MITIGDISKFLWRIDRISSMKLTLDEARLLFWGYGHKDIFSIKDVDLNIDDKEKILRSMCSRGYFLRVGSEFMITPRGARTTREIHAMFLE